MLKDLNQLIDYIEEHLTEGLSYKIIAENTGISEYQLKRIFTFIAGMSLMDYIKNRRLALANRDLLDGSRVTETAFRYGYETVEGFSRAFRDWSGYLPSEISRYGIQKSFPRLTFLLMSEEENRWNFVSKRKNSFMWQVWRKSSCQI